MLATHKPGLPANSSTDRSPLQLAGIVAAIAILVFFMGYMGYKCFVPSSPSMSQIIGMDKSSFPGWVNDAAMQCQGNMSKLSPEMQQKVAAQYKDGGRTEIMASYALQTH